MKDFPCVTDVLIRTMSTVLKIESKFPFQYEVDILLIIVQLARRMVQALNWIVSHPLFKRGFLLPNCSYLSLFHLSVPTASEQKQVEFRLTIVISPTRSLPGFPLPKEHFT